MYCFGFIVFSSLFVKGGIFFLTSLFEEGERSDKISRERKKGDTFFIHYF